MPFLLLTFFSGLLACRGRGGVIEKEVVKMVDFYVGVSYISTYMDVL